MRNSYPLKGFLLLGLLFLLTILQVHAQQDNYTDDETKEVIVKFTTNVVQSEKRLITEKTKAVVLKRFENTDTELWRIPLIVEINGQTLKGLNTITDYVKSHPGIQYIEPNYSITISNAPDDPSFNKLWGLHNTGQLAGLEGADIGGLSAWEITTGNSDIIIGVLDTGIDWTHQDLADNIWQNLGEDADGDGHVLEWSGGKWIFDPGDQNGIDDDQNGKIDDIIGWDFVNNDNNPYDDNGHGTHVSGIIAAKGNNGIGITGVAWQAQLMPLKIFDGTGNGNVFSVQEALDYALQMGASATNVSWGTPENSQTLEEAFETTEDNDHIIVAAAGNNGRNNDNLPVYPASYDFENIIAVAATDRHNSLTLFSNYGEKSVDIGAPGGEIYSTLPGNFYGWYSGTSMAAPYVTGAIALALGTCNNPTVSQLKDHLLNAATPLASMNGKTYSGNLHIRRFLDNVFSPNANFTYATDGLEIEFVASDGREDINYQWEYGDNVVETFTEDEAEHEFDEAGHYVVCLTVSDDCGSNTSCQDIYVNTDNILPDCDPEWQQFTSGDHILSLAIEGDNLWSGSKGGLAKINRIDNSHTFYTNNNSGLPHNHINAITVDKNGVKWIGTKAGLTKFDGTNWTTFNKQNSGLPVNNVQSIAVTETGQIWVATKGKGIALFNGESNWVVLNSNNAALPDDNVKDMIIDNNGDLYAATSSGGVAKLSYTTNSFITWNTGNSVIPNNAINDIALDATSGNIWIVTEGGIALYNGSNWEQVSDEGITNTTLSVGIDASGMQWVGTTSGIYNNNAGLWQPESAPLGSAPERINAILTTDNGEKWFGTNRSLRKLDINQQPSTITQLNSPLSGNAVNAFAEDDNEKMWIGTDNGLIQFFDDEWIQYPEFEGVEIHALYYDEDGKLWAGTNSDILEIDIDDEDDEDLSYTTHTPFNDAVHTITSDEDDGIWIGTKGSGIAVYEDGWTTYTTANSNLPNNTIHRIVHDEDTDAMWIATEGGVANLDQNNNWTIYNTANSNLTDNLITDIAIDNNDVKWLTTTNSVSNFTGGTWVNQNIPDLPKNIQAILIDENDDKWLATNEGLCKFNEYGCSIYNVSNSPLPSDNLQTISRDEKGYYWIGTESGFGILSALTASFAFDKQLLCTSTLIPFHNSSSSAASYDWYINDVYVSSDADYTHDFQEFGTHEVKLITKSDTDCRATFIEEITIGGRADDLDLGADLNVCDIVADLKSDIPNMQTYRWYKDEVMVSNESEYIAYESGDYIIEVQDWCGNWKTDTLSVTLSDRCVWAGDTNNDGVVDARDVLPIGQYEGSTGPTRANPTVWDGQAAPDWSEDEKAYADANGDGLINSLDTEIVYANYNQTHGEAGMGLNSLGLSNGANLSSQTLNTPPDAYICAEVQEASLFNGDPDILFDVKIVEESGITLESYGLAYTFKYGGNLDTVDFSNAWLIGNGTFDDMLTFTQSFPGQTDIAISRQDQSNLIGGGDVGQIVVFEDVPTGEAANIENLYIYSVENITLTDNNGNLIPVKGHTLVISHPGSEAGSIAEIALSVKGLAMNCLGDGEATVTVHGGTAPFTYLWDNGETTASVSDLSAGLHYLTVTDATGISITGMAYVEDHTGIYLSVDVTAETNTNIDGSIMLNTSGSSGFAYQWSTGQTSPTIAGLEAGTYTVTISNTEGCQKIEQINVPGTVCLKPKFILEGAYDPAIGRMRTSLKERGYLPLISPYNTGESVSITAFDAANANDVIVDWVIVELRHENDKKLVSRQAGLLQSDGDVIALDGADIMKFVDIEYANYHVTVRHRNHLSIVSDLLLFDRNIVNQDFTQSANTWNPLYPPLRQLGTGLFGTLGGNVSQTMLARQEDINGDDNARWGVSNGFFGLYKTEDFSLDGDINGGDKLIWTFNNGNFIELPD